MREKRIETRLVQAVRANGGRALKFTPTESGYPDRIVLWPGGVVRFVELKAPGQSPSPLQLEVHRRLALLGHEVAVLDTTAAVEAWVADELGGTR